MLVVNYEDFDKVMSTRYKRMCDFMKSHNKSGHEWKSTKNKKQKKQITFFPC